MILIAGGTGTLGRRLVPSLVARGMSVRVLARHRPAARDTEPSRIEVNAGDVRDPAVLDRALDRVDTVVSAISGFGGAAALGSHAVDRDGNLALIEAARRANVGHVVLLSVHTAGPSHPIPLFRDKWAAEEALRASGLSWTIIRPTAYLETWLDLIGGSLVRTGTARIFGRGQNPINFVSARDVASVVELAIVDSSLRQMEFEVPGPENLTLGQLADITESVTGRRGRRQYLPRPMMWIAKSILAVVNPVLGAQIETALVMDTRDMAIDGARHRSQFPAIRMTTAAEVASELFVSGLEIGAQRAR